MARDLAIDLGTANTLVYARGQGIILNEPTVIALNSRTQDVLAMGHDAWQMIGRTPGYIVAVRPLRGGAITDFDITQRMIRLLFQRAGVSRMYRARVLICVPSAITHVEQRAVLVDPPPLFLEQPGAADRDARLVGRGGQDLEVHNAAGGRVGLTVQRHLDGVAVSGGVHRGLDRGVLSRHGQGGRLGHGDQEHESPGERSFGTSAAPTLAALPCRNERRVIRLT